MNKRLLILSVLFTGMIIGYQVWRMDVHALVVNSVFLLLLNLIWIVAAYVASRRHKAMLQKQFQAETKALETQERFNTVFKHTNNGLATITAEGVISAINPAFCRMLGYQEFELLNFNFLQLLHLECIANLQLHIQKLCAREIDIYHDEVACYRENKKTVWLNITLTLVETEEKGTQVMMQAENISSAKEAEENLKRMAYHDALTGLPNRNKLDQFLMHAIASSRRHRQSFAVLFLDIDHFKVINDTLGHDAGDMMLQIISERLRVLVRSTDLVARLGGDEFVVVITDVKQVESVAIIANKILESILKMILIKGREVFTSTSIGISVYPNDGYDAETLIQNADMALYRSKEEGRNNYQFYTLEMTGKAQAKLAMQRAMEISLLRDEFYLNYQPIMELNSRRVTGLEALLRWKHPEYGSASTADVIALAEESGLIIPLSEKIFVLATKQLKAWHDLGLTSLTVAFNCTPKQIKQSSFSEDLMEALNKVGLPPSAIEIEVTENSIMQDPEPILRALYSLKDLGMKIVIDDFGTGYWSLSNLRRLSIDKVKIDRSVINMVMKDETYTSIASAIIAMVNRLGVKSVAEGVETKEQYDWLQKQGCSEIQGYYLTQPLNSDEMLAFLKHPIPAAESVTPDENKVEV